MERVKILEVFEGLERDRKVLGDDASGSTRNDETIERRRLRERLHLRHCVSGFLEQSAQRFTREKAHVRDVQYAVRAIFPSSSGQVVETLQVANVGHACDHPGAGGEPSTDLDERVPGIVEMF